jgi:DNA-binding response OmpR family regulator
VLLIEDDQGSARGLRTLLVSRGYRVDVAADAGDALLRAEDGTYDLVVADCDLGGQDGTEVVKSLRQRRPELPVLVVTARDRGGVLASLDGLAGEDCFEKPVRPEDLLAAVKKRLPR